MMSHLYTYSSLSLSLPWKNIVLSSTKTQLKGLLLITLSRLCLSLSHLCHPCAPFTVFIDSFNKYLWRGYCLPGSTFNTKNIMMNLTATTPANKHSMLAKLNTIYLNKTLYFYSRKKIRSHQFI